MRRKRALVGGIVISAATLLCLAFGVQQQIQQREQNRRRLFHAIQVNDTGTVRALLESGMRADVHLSRDAPLSLWEQTRILLHLGAHARRAPGISTLHQALQWGSNAEIVRLLLSHGAQVSINTVEEGWTPLGQALATDHPNIDIVRLLLEKGANPNALSPYAGGDRPLFYALSNDSQFVDLGPMTKLLLDHGADPMQPERGGHTYLTAEIWAGHVKTVAAMLDRGADINARDQDTQGVPGRSGTTPLGAAICAGHIPMLKLLLTRGANILPADHVGLIGDAVYAQDEAFLKRLLADGISIDSRDERGFTPLMRDAYGGYPHQMAAMKLLLKHGADVNARNKEGQTLLMVASWYPQDLPKLPLLLAHGADPNAQDRTGETALGYASMQEHGGGAGIAFLLAHGANARYANRHGYTVLMSAAINGGDPKGVPLLAAAGCDPDAHNDQGGTALTLARLHHHPTIIAALRQAGATR